MPDMSLEKTFLAVEGVWWSEDSLTESFKERFIIGSMTESQESLMKSIYLTFMSERAGEEILRFELWVLGGDGVSLIVSYLAKAEFKFSGLSEYSET